MASCKELSDCTVLPVNDQYSIRFHVKMTGPRDTPYQDGQFCLDLKYPKDDINLMKQPRIYFRTQIYHPNINSWGEIYYPNIVQNEQHNWSIENTLLRIKSLLYQPDADGFLVPEAAYLFKHNRQKFDERAKDWTTRYANETPINKVENTISDTSHTIIYPRRERFTDIEELSVGTSFIHGQSERHPIMIQKCFEMKKIIEERLNAAHRCLIFDENDLRYLFKILYWFWSETGKLNNENKYFAELEQLHDDEKIYGGTELISIDLFQCMYKAITSQELLKNQKFVRFCEGLNVDSQINILEDLYQKISIFCNPLVDGIEYEWQLDGKSDQAAKLIRELKMTNNISKCCMHMYTHETFLYRKVNEFLRKNDKSRLLTLSLYVCQLLEFFKDNQHLSPKDGLKVYRAVELSTSMIDDYRKAIKTTSYRWLSFSSATLDPALAEFYGRNTIFIMRLKKIYSDTKAIDISGFSQFGEGEQEILLKPGTEFTIEKVEYDDNSKKHHIHLNVYC